MGVVDDCFCYFEVYFSLEINTGGSLLELLEQKHHGLIAKITDIHIPQLWRPNVQEERWPLVCFLVRALYSRANDQLWLGPHAPLRGRMLSPVTSRGTHAPGAPLQSLLTALVSPHSIYTHLEDLGLQHPDFRHHNSASYMCLYKNWAICPPR